MCNTDKLKKKKLEGLRTTAKQRRRKLDRWMNKDLYHSCKGRGIKFPGLGENNPNIMTNKTRRELGLEQDPNLPDFISL